MFLWNFWHLEFLVLFFEWSTINDSFWFFMFFSWNHFLGGGFTFQWRDVVCFSVGGTSFLSGGALFKNIVGWGRAAPMSLSLAHYWKPCMLWSANFLLENLTLAVTHSEFFSADRYPHQTHKGTTWLCLFLDFFVKYFQNYLSLYNKNSFFVDNF